MELPKNMTLMDYYAGLAMQGMMSNSETRREIQDVGPSRMTANAWHIAEAMVKGKDLLNISYDKHISDCSELSVRARNALIGDGIETVGQLLRCSSSYLQAVVNLGNISRSQVLEFMAREKLNESTT